MTMVRSSIASLLAETTLPPHEIERLLSVATGLSRVELIRGVELTAAQMERFRDLARRRIAGEPLQYLEGSVPFGPVELIVDRRVLVPRQETEQLWELIVQREEVPPGVVVDLCTGSGNLALALKHSWAASRVVATDIDSSALEVARLNAGRNRLDVEIREGDLFAALPADLVGAVDVLVANPPYVAEGDAPLLPIDVREHEPAGALFGGRDGLDVLRRIAAEASAWLRPEGRIFCEIGADQRAAVARLFAEYEPDVVADLSGRPRFLVGVRVA